MRGWNGIRQSVKPQVEADWTRVRLPTAPRMEGKIACIQVSMR